MIKQMRYIAELTKWNGEKETINNLIADYEKRLTQQQELMSDMEHKLYEQN